MRNDSPNNTLSNFKAAILVNAVFLFQNLLSMIPEWVYPGDPATDAIYDAKILAINIVNSFKNWTPYLVVWIMWRHKLKVDALDASYLGLFIFTCMVDSFDAFINPYRSTYWDWWIVILIWVILTGMKFFNYIKINHAWKK